MPCAIARLVGRRIQEPPRPRRVLRGSPDAVFQLENDIFSAAKSSSSCRWKHQAIVINGFAQSIESRGGFDAWQTAICNPLSGKNL